MTLGTREFSKEAKSAIAVMRSLIISEKGTSSLFRILGDFRKEEGHPLMYKDFGYRSAAEFLEATGEFILREQNGEVVIFVKPSEESSHIQKMIAAQKSTKPRGAPKKPTYSTTWNNTPYQTNRYPSGGNKFGQYSAPKQQSSFYQQQSKPYYSYPQQQQHQSKPFGSFQQQVRPAGTSFQQQPKPVSSYQQQQRFKNPNNPLSSFFGVKAATGVPSPYQVPTPKPAPVVTKINPTNPFLQPSTNPFKPNPPVVVKPPAPAIQVKQENVQKMDITPPFETAPKRAPQQTQQPASEDQQMDTTENSAPAARTFRQAFKAPTVISAFAPQNISRVVQTQQENLLKQETATTDEALAISPTKPPLAPFAWDQEPGATPEQLLFRYGQSYGSLPVYKFFEVRKRFQCKVTINGTVYRTYPNDYATEQESKSAVAQLAIDAIRRNETRQYAVCDGTDEEIAAKIYDLLLPCQYGMLLDNIPKAFRDAHGSLLPKHWKLIVQSHLTRLFKTEEIPSHSLNVFAVLPEEKLSEEARRMSTNAIELPWSEQYWDLYLTNPVSPDEIWARLIGPEYSDKMDDLMTTIEHAMATKKMKPKKITTGEYYLVEVDECWHRVRVEKIERAEGACQCFFVDIGGTSSVPIDKIYSCSPGYLKLPSQAVQFSLQGLQDISDDNSSVEAYLQEHVSGKILIADVHTAKHEYEANDDDPAGCRDKPIRITLYDTSTDENVDINAVLKGLRNESPER